MTDPLRAALVRLLPSASLDFSIHAPEGSERWPYMAAYIADALAADTARPDYLRESIQRDMRVEDGRVSIDVNIWNALLDDRRLAADTARPLDATEPCPTCWQPVPVPQRGDHDYGIPLRAESRNATLTEVVRVVEGLPLPDMYFDGPPTWTDGTDAMRAAVLDAVKALQSPERT